MNIIRLNGTKMKQNTAAAIGFFDGVHIAHQKLITEMIKIADKENLRKAVITFDVHPKSVLFGLDYFYITPLERKIEQLKKFELDELYIIEFTKEKAKLQPDDFINYYLNGINTLVCGFDFKFGVRGSGTINTLLQHPDFNTIIVSEITYDGFKVGSTHIRDLINSGLVEQVQDILGDHYSIKGEVIHGAKKGRTIGFPTANIDTEDYIIPKTGVYATLTKVKGHWHQSMSSVGHNPTLNCRTDVSVESHLFDFDEDIYGEIVELKFIKRLRDEEKFTNVDDLITKIKEDQVNTLEILENYN
jgi:riboflavin kinase/FMN adenylyltransferase